MQSGSRAFFMVTGLALITLLYYASYSEDENVAANFKILLEDNLSESCDLTLLKTKVSLDLDSIKTYQDLETALCPAGSIKNKKQQQLAACPSRGIVSMFIGGRTGNQIWEYISIWANALETGLIPYVPYCAWRTVDAIFQNISLRPMQDISHCFVEFPLVANFHEWSCLNQSLIIEKYNFEHTRLVTRLNDARNELKFRSNIQNWAESILQSLANGRKYTYVAVHVRRTDYEDYLKRTYGDKVNFNNSDFYTHAMDYYRSKYKNCLFIYISDDPRFCTKKFGQLKDVRIISQHSRPNPPEVDLALMAACNHTIFDYGTFGRWGSILAGGEVIYLNMIQNKELQKFFGNHSWKPME